jgi:hypothetical protein
VVAAKGEASGFAFLLFVVMFFLRQFRFTTIVIGFGNSLSCVDLDARQSLNHACRQKVHDKATLPCNFLSCGLCLAFRRKVRDKGFVVRNCKESNAR